jgi:hypothetical protein
MAFAGPMLQRRGDWRPVTLAGKRPMWPTGGGPTPQRTRRAPVAVTAPRVPATARPAADRRWTPLQEVFTEKMANGGGV